MYDSLVKTVRDMSGVELAAYNGDGEYGTLVVESNSRSYKFEFKPFEHENFGIVCERVEFFDDANATTIRTVNDVESDEIEAVVVDFLKQD